VQKTLGPCGSHPLSKHRCRLPERTTKLAVNLPSTSLYLSPNRETKVRAQPAAKTTKPEKVRNGVRLENLLRRYRVRRLPEYFCS